MLDFGFLLAHEHFNFGHSFEFLFRLDALVKEQRVDDRNCKEKHRAHHKGEH